MKPRRLGGAISAMYAGIERTQIPVMPNARMRPIVNWAAVVAEICKATALSICQYFQCIAEKNILHKRYKCDDQHGFLPSQSLSNWNCHPASLRRVRGSWIA